MRAVFLILLICVGSGTLALTLEEQQQYDEWKAYLLEPSESFVTKFHDSCGFDAPVTIDEKMVPVFTAAKENAGHFCDAPRAVLREMCDTPSYKAAVKRNVKKIVCKLNEAKKLGLTLKGGTVTLFLGTEVAHLEREIKIFFNKNLK